MNPKKAFKEIVDICYEEEDYFELHKEVLSIENGMKHKERTDEDYIRAIGDVLQAIYTFAFDFDQENYLHIEEIYNELSEQI